MKQFMSTVAIAAMSIAILARTPAYATLDASFECAGFKATPQEAVDADPVVKTSIEMGEVEYDEHGRKHRDYLHVIHTTLTGKEYDREKQYPNFRHWFTQGNHCCHEIG